MLKMDVFYLTVKEANRKRGGWWEDRRSGRDS